MEFVYSLMFNIYLRNQSQSRRNKSPYLSRPRPLMPSIRISNHVHIYTRPNINLSCKQSVPRNRTPISLPKDTLTRNNRYQSKNEKVHSKLENKATIRFANKPQPASVFKPYDLIKQKRQKKTIRLPTRQRLLKKQPEPQLPQLKLLIGLQDRLQDFKLVQRIGQGGYAQVYKGQHLPTGLFFAVKIYDKLRLPKLSKLQSIRREIRLLSQLANYKHPYINRLIQSEQKRTLIYLVLEICKGGSLFDKIGNPEFMLKPLIRQLVQTLLFLQSKGIAHRDIKAENVLLEAGKVRLIDFGFALKVEKNQVINTYCGTPTYMSPEIVSRTPHNPILSDRWSLGILIYMLIAAKYPFNSQDQNCLFEQIRLGKVQFSPAFSKQAQSLISRLLRVAPQDRINYQEVLESAWLNST